jgi:hypothetical protein
VTITVEAQLSFAEAFRANLAIVRWMPRLAISYAFPFLFGIALFLWNFEDSQVVTFVDVFPCMFVSICPIFIVLMSAWKMRAYWRKHGGTVFQFDDDNILAKTGLYSATIPWAAIDRVRTAKEFIFIFTSTRAIFMVPRRALSASDEPALLAMARS